MQPSDADTCFGKVLREAKPSTRTGRAAALTVYFQFLELRHKIELHNVTGRVIECPLDEMNRPRGRRRGPGREGAVPRGLPRLHRASRPGRSRRSQAAAHRPVRAGEWMWMLGIAAVSLGAALWWRKGGRRIATAGSRSTPARSMIH